MKTNIILTGFMGAGKSVIGKKLEATCKKGLVSTDDLIEKREGRPITAIFKDSGEPYFRKVEDEVTREVSQQTNVIVDCGGGIVLNKDNVANLKQNGVVFYLSATPEQLFERIKGETHRPLLHVDNPLEKIRELLKCREPFYRQADHTIDTSDKTVDDIAKEIIRLMPNE